MSNFLPFLDLPNCQPHKAAALLLPLPFEGAVSFGGGTAQGPEAIWRASTEVELWDEQLDFDLQQLLLHSAPAVRPSEGQSAADYLREVLQTAETLHEHQGLVLGVGGDHSLTPPLVSAAANDPDDLSDLTIVQFDAHADLRDEYLGTPYSHACAMRRLVERGASLLAIGIRSAEREEFEYGRQSGRVRTYPAQRLVEHPEDLAELASQLRRLEGDVYLTFDIDVLEVHLCPGTGTPQPGGLGWWPTVGLLEALLRENRLKRLVGVDLVETAPQSGSVVNEFVAARLLAKMLAFQLVCP